MRRAHSVLLVLSIVALTIGVVAWRLWTPETTTPNETANDTIWTCAMHPQIKLPDPGRCPICGMELIPLQHKDNDASGESLRLSERARQLAEVETVPVTRGEIRLEIRMYGKLAFDESRLSHITARTPGRIERLFLDYTGISVKQGDHMVDLYSPELVTAQQELVQAARAQESQRDEGSTVMARMLEKNLANAQEKLRLWGLSPSQIQNILESGAPQETLTILAPMSGVVIHKDAVEGKYVDEGTRIYTIADLSELWLMLDAYESDLTWLRHGQDIEFQAEAIPGETFSGLISFIDPVLSERTHTVRVRANVSNSDGRLKAGMLVRAVVRPQLDASGRVVSKSLEGKWIGPMHPQIVREKSGSCPICGMDLVPSESLGYAVADLEGGQLPLLIPATAPLITGKRAVVYVENPHETGSYTARVVTLGPRAGSHYVVYEGLTEGERVVIKGNFKIDSAAQIIGKPSMMAPGGQSTPQQGHHH